MKFSLYNKKNQLDEMQEQTMLSIEARGFWLLWAGLLLAILVQLILGTPISQWVGEFVVFMAGCIYTMIECIRNGLWVWGDRIFEKCGIGRDEGGDGGKTLEIRGKRRLSARDGGANYQQS